MPVCFTEIPSDYPYRKTGRAALQSGGLVTPYTFCCEDVPLCDPQGRTIGTVFAFSYLTGPADRPVMFIFNGGPGSNSTWLQLGFLSPRICAPDAAGMPRAQGPYALRDNPDCLLDLCDLVFYNPPGAGYSRLFDEAAAPLVFGDHADADAAEQFIRAWLRAHGENRPVFLLGESFGSTRASLLAYRLRDTDLRGVLHVGPGITGDETVPRSIKDLIPVCATHYYYDEDLHRQISLADFLQTQWQFLYRTYIPALARGNALPAEEARDIASYLASVTGLSPSYYETHGLRISRSDFRSLRLKDQGLKIGSFDTRFTLPCTEDEDPTLARFEPYIAAGAREHYLGDLGLTLSRALRDNSLNSDDTFLWPFNAEYDMEGLGGNWYPMKMTVSEAAAKAYEARPSLRFFFATGIYDTVATVMNTHFAVSHTRVPPEAVTLREYESGHAVYADEASRHALARDIRQFLMEVI